MWKRRHREQTYAIKCTTIDLRYKDVRLAGLRHANRSLMGVRGRAHPSFGMTPTFDFFVLKDFLPFGTTPTQAIRDLFV